MTDQSSRRGRGDRPLDGAMQEALRKAGLARSQPTPPAHGSPRDQKPMAPSGHGQKAAKELSRTNRPAAHAQGGKHGKQGPMHTSGTNGKQVARPQPGADRKGQPPPPMPTKKIEHLLPNGDAVSTSLSPAMQKPSTSSQGLSHEQRLDRIHRRLTGLAAATEQRGRRAAASCVPSAEDLRDLRGRLYGGGGAGPSLVRGRRPLDVVLGVDFGTSSTKIVARFPYLPGSPAYAIPVPAFARAEGHAYLWASRIWLTAGGKFALSPRDGSAVSCAIKAHLMRAEATEPVLVAGLVQATAEEVAAAFLALQLRQALGWLATAQATLLRQQSLRLSYNFGFPAASLEAKALRDRYERCIAAALPLSDGHGELSLTDVQRSLQSSAGGASTLLQAAQAQLFPEIAAAVSGFANSISREDGLYALVDVGGGTVDCCTFNLFNDALQGGRCPIFRAEVDMLGVDPWRLCQDDEDLEADFKALLDTLQRRVIWETKHMRYPTSERWKTVLPVFFTGGGIASDVHRESTYGLEAWLRHHTRGDAGVRIETLPPPKNLEHPLCPAADVHRLIVAIGLSQEAGYIPDVTLPGDISDAPPPSQKFTAERNDDD
jgi:hypothetical protein